MKKLTKRDLFILIAVLTLVIILIQVVVLTDENTTYNPTLLYVVLGFLAAELVVGLLIVVLVGIKNGKIARQLLTDFSNKQYESVIANESVCSKLKKGTTRDTLTIAVAVSYLELGQSDKFVQLIDTVQDSGVAHYKYFWKAVYSISVANAEDFALCQQKHSDCGNNNEKNILILELIEKYKIRNDKLTEEERKIVDELHYDAIKSLFN